MSGYITFRIPQRELSRSVRGKGGCYFSSAWHVPCMAETETVSSSIEAFGLHEDWTIDRAAFWSLKMPLVENGRPLERDGSHVTCNDLGKRFLTSVSGYEMVLMADATSWKLTKRDARVVRVFARQLCGCDR